MLFAGLRQFAVTDRGLRRVRVVLQDLFDGFSSER
jgi:hypothetical protein